MDSFATNTAGRKIPQVDLSRFFPDSTVNHALQELYTLTKLLQSTE